MHTPIHRCLALLACLASTAQAHVIDLRAGAMEALDGAASLTLSAGGVTVTLRANQGVLNRTGSGFGINSPGGGDDADGLDGARGDEMVSFVFDAPVTDLAVRVSRLGGGDAGAVLAGATRVVLAGSGLTALDGLYLAPFRPLAVAHLRGNGFSLDALHFRAVPAGTPGTLALAALLGAVPAARAWQSRRPGSRMPRLPDAVRRPSHADATCSVRHEQDHRTGRLAARQLACPPGTAPARLPR